MEYIYDSRWNVVRYGRSMNHVRRYVSNYKTSIEFVAIAKIDHGKGFLNIMFTDGSNYTRNFPSYPQVRDMVRRWRNLYGAKLFVQGVRSGTVDPANAYLKEN